MNTSNKGFISYHLVSPLRRWLTPVIVIALFSLVVIALYFDKEPPDGLLKFYGIFGGFGLILSLATYWIAGYTKLITSKKDITLRQIGPTLSTGWDNIERIELTSEAPFNRSTTTSLPELFNGPGNTKSKTWCRISYPKLKGLRCSDPICI